MHFTFSRIFLLICVLLVSGAILWIGLALLLARAILTPPRMSAGKAIYHLRRLSPGDLGLNYEEQSFSVRDERNGKKLHIAAWWIPADDASDRTAVLIHGYADAKVGAIAWAPLLHRQNLNILAIDLRAHGESDGTFCTGGFFERDDLDQVLDQLRIQRPTDKLILFGVSLGAAVASAVAARRDDLAAMILESPFSDYERVITRHFELLRLPTGLLLRAAIKLAEHFSGADFSRVKTSELLGQAKCPALLIIGQADPLLDETDIAVLQQTGASCWLVENAGHIDAMSIDPVAYQQRIEAFLESTFTGVGNPR